MNVRQIYTCKPFVKWAGGKRQLIPEIRARLPESFNEYYEPFVGGGAVLFDLCPRVAHINDANKELITTYQCFQDKSKVAQLKALLKEHEARHSSDYYYMLRSLDRTTDFQNLSDVEVAARFIYLNKSCFNGIYRVNSKGFFNVPFGKKEAVTLYDEDNFEQLEKYIADAAISITNIDFEDAVSTAKSGDFVYLDPPYDSDTSTFTSYTASAFGKDEQARVAKVFKVLADRGCYVMLSNHNTELVNSLFAQYRIDVVSAKRAINSDASRRGSVEEVIVRNY